MSIILIKLIIRVTTQAYTYLTNDRWLKINLISKTYFASLKISHLRSNVLQEKIVVNGFVQSYLNRGRIPYRPGCFLKQQCYRHSRSRSSIQICCVIGVNMPPVIYVVFSYIKYVGCQHCLASMLYPVCRYVELNHHQTEVVMGTPQSLSLS